MDVVLGGTPVPQPLEQGSQPSPRAIQLDSTLGLHCMHEVRGAVLSFGNHLFIGLKTRCLNSGPLLVRMMIPH